MRSIPLLWVALSLLTMASFAQNHAEHAQQSTKSAQVVPNSGADRQSVQQIEDDWLKAERTTDPAAVEKFLSDDFVNLTPTGIGPGKADLLRNFREHAGEPPPYSVRQEGMRIYILGDAAVAAYVKTYVAKENGNVAKEDSTHVFTKDRGVWKLRVSRTSPHQEEANAVP